MCPRCHPHRPLRPLPPHVAAFADSTLCAGNLAKCSVCGGVVACECGAAAVPCAAVDNAALAHPARPPVMHQLFLSHTHVMHQLLLSHTHTHNCCYRTHTHVQQLTRVCAITTHTRGGIVVIAHTCINCCYLLLLSHTHGVELLLSHTHVMHQLLLSHTHTHTHTHTHPVIHTNESCHRYETYHMYDMERWGAGVEYH